MIVKTHLIFIVAIVSGFLLTVQFLTLQILVRESKQVANPTWSILYAVVSIARDTEVPLFLIDPLVLEKIGNRSLVSHDPLHDDNYCQILCQGQKITHLATAASITSQMSLMKLSLGLRGRGLTVLEMKDQDPTLVVHGLKVNIPVHWLIMNEKSSKEEAHIIHMIILHDRISSKYWWQGHLDLNEMDRRLLHRQGARRNDFRTTVHAAIYPKSAVLPAIVDGLVIGSPWPNYGFLTKNPEDNKFLECDTLRAKDFYSKHPREDTSEANVFRTRAYNVIRKVTRLLDELGVPFWLSSGTLLGYYRQCDIFPWAQDVDIGVFIEDFTPAIIDKFSQNDLPLLHIFGKPQDSYELSFHDSFHIKLDIFFFYREVDHHWNGGTDVRTGQKYKYVFPKFHLCWTEFLELRVRVPCQIEAYIQANYGPDWMEPVKTWDWIKSPFNVQPNGIWPQDEWSLVMQTFTLPQLQP